MPTTTTLKGTLTIGEPPHTVTVPVSTTIPPAKPNDFILDYTASDAESAPQLQIGSYIAWVAKQFDLTIADDDLPSALQDVTAAILKLHIDSTGPFGVQVELGTMANNKFQSAWTPVPGLTVGDISFVVTNMSDFTTNVSRTILVPSARMLRARSLVQA